MTHRIGNFKFSDHLIILIFGAMLSLSALSQEVLHLDSPIRLVVPFPAGGSADIVARVIAKSMTQSLHQSVVVENKPGADGAIAAEYVAKSKPDGNTLFFATYGAMSAAPALHKSIHYDVMKDFSPISTTGKFSFFLFTHPSVPVKTASEFVAYVHTHPGELNFGTGNVGSIVATAELMNSQHMDMIHVPYKGEVPAMNDFLAGRIQLMIGTPSNTLNWVKEGKLNALLTFSDKRSELFPDTPTANEVGLKSLSTLAWAGIFGPANMELQKISLLNKAVITALHGFENQAEFARQGFDPISSTPYQLTVQVKSQLQIWGKSIQLAGIQVD
jgi:tripartite-type tricarboxylate transporter receptor subunit TctC